MKRLLCCIAILTIAVFVVGCSEKEQYNRVSCTLPSGIVCSSASFESGVVEITLQNKLQFDVEDVQVSVGGCNTPSSIGNFATDEEKKLTFSGCSFIDFEPELDRVSVDISLQYTNAVSKLTHDMIGALRLVK